MTEQTAGATREPKAQLVAGGNVAAIIPRNVEEVFRLAAAVHAAGMAPQSLKSAEQVTVAIMAGAELGFAPFQALQSFAVVNGRPSLWGDALPALLWARGFVIEEWFDDEDKPTKAFCKVIRPGGIAETVRTYSLDDAKKANLVGKAGPWQTNQKRMLQMRARAFAARDGAADALKGFQVREEVEDYQPIREVAQAAPTGMRARLESRGTSSGGFDAGSVSGALDEALGGDDLPHDAETVEVTDSEPDKTTLAPGLKTGADLLAEQAGDDDGFPGDRG